MTKPEGKCIFPELLPPGESKFEHSPIEKENGEGWMKNKEKENEKESSKILKERETVAKTTEGTRNRSVWNRHERGEKVRVGRRQVCLHRIPNSC